MTVPPAPGRWASSAVVHGFAIDEGLTIRVKSHGHRNGPTVLSLVRVVFGLFLLVQALLPDTMATPD